MTYPTGEQKGVTGRRFRGQMQTRDSANRSRIVSRFVDAGSGM